MNSLGSHSLFTAQKGKPVFILVFLAISCSAPENNSVAMVNRTPIPIDTYISRYDDFLQTTHLHDNLEYRHMFVQSMVDEILLLDYADKTGLASDPDHRQELENIKNQFLLNALNDHEISAAVVPSELEMRKLFRYSKTRLHVQHLFARDLESISAIAEALNQGVSWDSLAARIFQDPALASSGGDLGFVKLGDLDPEFEQAAYALSDGVISDPVMTEYGYSIIRVVERETDPLLVESDFQKQIPFLTRIGKSYKKRPLVRQYTDKVLATLSLEFNPDGLIHLAEYWSRRSGQVLEASYKFADSPCIRIGAQNKTLTIADCVHLLNQLSPTQQSRLLDSEELANGISGILVRSELLKKAVALGMESDPEFTQNVTLKQNNYIIKQAVNSIRKIYPDSDIVAQREGYISFRDSLKNLSRITIDSVLVRNFIMEQPI